MQFWLSSRVEHFFKGNKPDQVDEVTEVSSVPITPGPFPFATTKYTHVPDHGNASSDIRLPEAIPPVPRDPLPIIPCLF